MRILPLGSPWSTLNRLYGALCMTMTASAVGVVYPGWVRLGGTRGGVLPSHPPMTSGLVLPGPNHCLRPVYRVPAGTPEALLASSAHLQLPHPYLASWTQYGEIQGNIS